jgi:hypothetical protein
LPVPGGPWRTLICKTSAQIGMKHVPRTCAYQTAAFAADNIRDNVARRVRVLRHAHERLDQQLKTTKIGLIASIGAHRTHFRVRIEYEVRPRVLIEYDVGELCDVELLPRLTDVLRAGVPSAAALLADFVREIKTHDVHRKQKQLILRKRLPLGVAAAGLSIVILPNDAYARIAGVAVSVGVRFRIDDDAFLHEYAYQTMPLSIVTRYIHPRLKSEISIVVELGSGRRTLTFFVMHTRE